MTIPRARRAPVLACAASLALSAALSSRARAEEPAAIPVEERLDRAKRLFEEGKRLRDEGKLAAALERFQASRDAHSSFPNTKNVAVALYRLGRHGEALSVYRELLAAFGSDLDTEERRSIEIVIRELEPLAAAGAAPPPRPPEAPVAEAASPAPTAAPPARPSPRRAGHRFHLDLVGGMLVSGGVAAELSSPCSSGSPTLGGLVGARAAIPVGGSFSLELGGGFLGFSGSCGQLKASTFGGYSPTVASTSESSVSPTPATYNVHRAALSLGGFATAGISYRRPLAGPFSWLARASAGLWLGEASETVGVDVRTSGHAPFSFEMVAGRARTPFTALLVWPEIGLEARLGKLRIGMGAGATITPVASGSLGPRRFSGPEGARCGTNELSAGAPSCANALSVTSERLLPLAAFSSSLFVGYDF